ncbi:prolipoprotein diacylglyceryl transferase [Haliovirga abyssi]|uniref:Phosphatidylglycerol--prolipoprotein diacylglyceryl transferase n=1 Tax=Haliovirga abyssi TaxID=2996794 RepID=A0AAU9D4X2_9FUSO|nr:prolipoprotein diacylglyceryl transferase [Haliovirga abyssi]BDU51019.1 prolipoprotein diacylglyceryl transferase [Haliovirga abyssi]
MHPVFLKFGIFEIRYYGLMYAIAFFLGLYLAKKEAKRLNIDTNLIEDYVFVAMISGLLGGRLYYVLLESHYYFAHPAEIIAVWHGGMAIHGGIIGGIIGTMIFAKVKKINIWTLGDIAAAPVILGQSIGRIGNLMNGDAHGVPTFAPLNIMLGNDFNQWWAEYLKGMHQGLKNLVPWGITFPVGTPAGNEFPNIPTHPVMVYEMILNFLAFLSIWFIFRKKKLAKGSLFFIYLIEYGVIRSIVTIFRADDLEILGLRAPHVASLIMITVGIYLLKKKNSKV